MATATATNMATVNIAISNYIPLRDIDGQYHINVPGASGSIAPFAVLPSPRTSSPTRSRISSPGVDYLSIGELLQEIHNETMLGHYNLPQYETILVQHGIANVNDVGRVRDGFLAELGFPSENFILKVFRDRAERAKLLAEGL
jgi:hypothetical protein